MTSEACLAASLLRVRRELEPQVQVPRRLPLLLNVALDALVAAELADRRAEIAAGPEGTAPELLTQPQSC